MQKYPALLGLLREGEASVLWACRTPQHPQWLLDRQCATAKGPYTHCCFTGSKQLPKGPSM
jgi:hypothetical protein